MEAIGRLAGGIAHGFNNVLTTIIGYGDLILASPDHSLDTLEEDVREIREAAQRGSGLSKQILAFSRRQALEPRVLSLNTIIASTERLLAPTIGADIELQVASDPNLGLAEIDDVQFVQVLLNLAVNARDAMPQGGRLTVAREDVDLTDEFCRTHPEASPGPYVHLVVSDTGVGMDQDTASHVFEPFFTMKAAGEGTGLGLATVYGVVTQSGGCIYVDSVSGVGTSFDIYFARFDRAAGGYADWPSPGPGWSRPTILLVDSGATFRAVTARMLERRGYRVLPLGDADRAATLLDSVETPLDLMLTDVVLPGSVQGIHLAQRAARVRPLMPVLYMSSHSRDTIEKTGRLNKDDDYLEKPFTAESLQHRIREALGTDG
jgi:two-component system cell cycle sensor histidine kinase/response regulator CckA